MKKAEWPRTVRCGSVEVKIYRSKHAKTASGFIFQVVFRDHLNRRSTSQFAKESDADDFARDRAELIAQGRTEVATLSRGDVDELAAIRAAAGAVPALSAIREWARAHELTRGHVLDAARAWAELHPTEFKSARGLVAEVIEDFIAAKNAAGNEGSATYTSKLRPLAEMFPGRELASLTSVEFSAYLETFRDAVTRNDHRKRAVTLCRWARNQRRLPRGKELEIELTERAKEVRTEIGVISPAVYGKLLEFFRAQHPQHLAALVLAGFCGIRSDEIHGKRRDRSRRQLWEDVYLDRAFVQVSNAKSNTPADRIVPLCPAAVAWLRLCPRPHEGPVCEPIAIESIRRLARGKGHELPDNCFRHSYISYRIAVVDGNKAQVATEAGNSVREIDLSYRKPFTKEDGLAWFALMPKEKPRT